MKKLPFIVTLLFSMTFYAQSSENKEKQPQNDVMIGLIELIAAPAINVYYERLIDENSGVGINGFFDLNKNSNTSQISPYYRMYFGKKYAAGFFVEGFVPITTTNDEVYNYSNTGSYYNYDKNTTVGIGVGFGGKWVVKKNILFEASMGIGRRFGNSSNLESVITGKGMLGIGYRF